MKIKSENIVWLEGMIENIKQDIDGIGSQASACLASKVHRGDTGVLSQDAAECAEADIPTVSASYNQSESQALADMCNDLKSKLNQAVILLNEIKVLVLEMNS